MCQSSPNLSNAQLLTFELPQGSQKFKLISLISQQLEISIINKLKAKKPEAIDLIYKHYGRALLGVILKVVKNTEHAEDVLQESLVKVWNNAHLYEEKKGRLYTWMLNICRNRALDKLRSKAYKQEMQIQEDENYVSQHTSSEKLNPDTIGVKDMTNILASDERELIDMVYFKGFSHRDLAKEINMPLGTVKTKIRSALKTLRERYKE